jgi:hypothetical protein
MSEGGIRMRRRRLYPKGYGLPSLVVVLFLVSVLVSAIADAMARDTVEARATAAFKGVEERLHAFEITGGDGTGLLPHLVASRDVRVSLIPAAFGQPAAALIEPSFRNGAEAALFDQQIRVFLNVPSNNLIGTLTPDQVRRKHPERVLRSGDRMGAPIGLDGDPSSLRSVLNAGETRTGTGHAAIGGLVGILSGEETSLFEGPALSAQRGLGSKLELSSGATSINVSVAGAVISPSASSGSAQVTGLLRGRDAEVSDTRVSGSFGTDTLDEQDQIYFDRVNVAGLRSELTRANLLSFGDRFGPAPGNLQTVIPLVDPEQIFSGAP